MSFNRLAVVYLALAIFVAGMAVINIASNGETVIWVTMIGAAIFLAGLAGFAKRMANIQKARR